MLSAGTRDRLIGATFMGAIWTILCLPIISGPNPVEIFLERLGPISVLTLPVLLVLWTAAFFGFLTLWQRRHRQ
jgi:hypothetical protein